MEDDVGGKEGMQAVMNVVLNRAAHPRWWGSSVYTVCMKPLQFSCWNNGSTNVVRFEEMLRNDPDNEQWEIARNLAQLAVSKVLPDITNNADSYHSVGSPYPAGWPSQKNVFFCGSIGGNSYYRLYLDPRSVNPAVV
jgi:spore germination cell wall hydrolase CwlJ-like protein